MGRLSRILCAALAAWLCAALAGGLPRSVTARAATAHTSPSALRELVAGMRLLNYFPARHPHELMWTEFDEAEIDGDLGRIAALHANTVRYVLDLRAFSVPTPPPAYLVELDRAVALAAHHGLRVQLTLFDHLGSCPSCGDYTAIENCERWADALLEALPRHDPRIAFVELQNEIDPRNDVAMRWAQQLLPYVRTASGGLPVTVSVVGGGDYLLTLKLALGSATPDLWDIHYYALPGSALADFRSAVSVAAPRPLLIGETGYSTYPGNTAVPGVPATAAAHEAYQDYVLRTYQLAARQAGLPPAAPWILDDLPCTGCTPAGCTLNCSPQPCPDCVDALFGLFRADGSPKPAAATIAALFGGAPIDTAFDPGFEQAAGDDPADWRLGLPGAANFARDSTVAHSGRASALIGQSTDDNGAAPCWYIEPMGQAVPGRRVTLRVWVRGRSVTGTTTLSIAWLDHAGFQDGGVVSAPLPTGDSDWTPLSVTGTPPPGALVAQIRLCSADDQGSVWFDDVEFVERS